MSDQPQTRSADAPRPDAARPGPPLLVSTQYVREMIVRVPGAPGVYAIRDIRPHVTLGIDVSVRQAEDLHPTYEVTLLMNCTATTHTPVEGEPPPPVAFVVEMAYAGIFIIHNLEPDAVEPVLFAECPRLLYPFARSVLADITTQAGFPPVLLQPFDFIALWQTKRANGGTAIIGAAKPAPAA